MNQELIKFCMEKGLLLDKESYSFLEDFGADIAKAIIEKISFLDQKIITKAFIERNATRISEAIGDERIAQALKIKLNLSLEINIEEKKQEKPVELSLGKLKIIRSYANLPKKLGPGDFVKYFRIRYSELKKILQERKELENLSSINKIDGNRQAVSIIGIVYSKRITKNKNIILEVEDLTGSINVLINKDKEVYEIAKDILVDDIIGIKGFGSKEILFASSVVYPDAFIEEKRFLDRNESVAFISDIHIGSNNFLEEKFAKFIEWINGNVGDEKQKQEALRIKYLLITGDCVDGVGIFPGQEEVLVIKDMREQYKALTSYLSKIRKDIKIIMCPGQHDSVRVAEPQPATGKDYAQPLYDLENVILVSNPAMIEISNNNSRGIKILMYHGASMHHYINEIEHLRLGKANDFPAKVVKELLKRRHLASMHSAVVYIPTEKQDFLAISEVPDIINTADLHRPEVDLYNNILIVCSSCWQSTTSFEEKVGNHPDPCKVPVVNLKTREVKILDFSE
ncbi:MAG: metallophosphoesterase [Candidatus Pacearchaeota archaeon]|nr:metallophosphoesterase [Candidatus Pacearchaeota archaeon]